jgi:UDP-N-acetylglucosamine 2-epimerase (non-hydrolysing)
LRYNTERPETLDVGSNVLVGTKPDKIVDCVKFMLGKKKDWETPFGDGKAGKRIVEILRHELD